MTTTGKYQIYGPPTDAGYAVLRGSIEQAGRITTPILIDEEGEILDGHQRAKIADELGIELPKIVIGNLSEDGKEQTALTANVNSRTQEEKHAAITFYLLKHPTTTDRGLARLVGVTHPTVASIRREIKSNGKSFHKDGERLEASGRKARGQRPKTAEQKEQEKAARELKKEQEKAEREAAAAKRQAELEGQRAKDAERRAAKDAEGAALYDSIREGAEGRGGVVKKKAAPRVVSARDRLRTALNDSIIAITRALNDPDLDDELLAAEAELDKALRIDTQRLKLNQLIKELAQRLKG